MIRSTSLAVTLLALAACDAGGPSADDPLVGTWTLSSTTSFVRVTVSEAQDVLDSTQPTQGDLAFTGGDTGRVRFVQYVTQIEDGVGFSLLSWDPARPAPARRSTLVVSDAPGTNPRDVILEVTDPDGSSRFYTSRDPATAPFSRSGWAYQFDDVVSEPDDANRGPVRLSGRFAFGSRTLPANDPTPLYVYSQEPGPFDQLTYTFRDDGSLTIRFAGGVPEAWTWERTDGGVRLTRSSAAPETLDLGVSFDGSALVLSSGASPGPCDRSCLEDAERGYGIAHGTLLSSSSVIERRFSPGSPTP